MEGKLRVWPLVVVVSMMLIVLSLAGCTDDDDDDDDNGNGDEIDWDSLTINLGAPAVGERDPVWDAIATAFTWKRVDPLTVAEARSLGFEARKAPSPKSDR